MQDSLTFVESKRELVAYLEQGCKPEGAWRIGGEYERLGFRRSDRTPLFYEGRGGIKDFLKRLADRFSWEPLMEGQSIIGLRSPVRGCAISLEPGGQVELSGSPMQTVHKLSEELEDCLEQMRVVGEELGIGFLEIGFSPKWGHVNAPRMPKRRYAIMTPRVLEVSPEGGEMMYNSCTVQVNLDFSSELDMVKKLRVALALQPIAIALFANSPFKEGYPSGFLSYRMEAWRYMDRRRSGCLPFVFEEGMGFERYVDYAFDVPIYFILRGERYITAGGQSFRDFMDGKLTALPGERPTMNDWITHLSTLFPEVRLSRVLEMRGADSGSLEFLRALPAFWVGLLYDRDVLDAMWDMVREWTEEERDEMRLAASRMGLAALFRCGSLQDVARYAVKLARKGLERRGCLCESGESEVRFLEPLEAAVQSGEVQADRLLRLYNGPWHRDINCIFDETSL